MEPEPSDDQQEPVTRPKICGRAITSLILSILFLVPLIGNLLALFGIIFGANALIRIARSRGKLTGTKFAVCGIIIGILGIIMLIPPTAWTARRVLSRLPDLLAQPVIRHTGMGMMIRVVTRGRVSQAKTDLRTIATGLEAYFVDNMQYPAWAKGDQGANSFAGPKAGAYHIHTFRIWRDESEVGTFATLTTPAAYLPYYLSDLFASTRGATYGYYSDENGWILFSWGPDYDENKRESWDLDPDVEMVYKSSISQPSLTLLTCTSSLSGEAYTYDPTNGSISPGDVYRVKQ